MSWFLKESNNVPNRNSLHFSTSQESQYDFSKIWSMTKNCVNKLCHVNQLGNASSHWRPPSGGWSPPTDTWPWLDHTSYCFPARWVILHAVEGDCPLHCALGLYGCQTHSIKIYSIKQEVRFLYILKVF